MEPALAEAPPAPVLSVEGAVERRRWTRNECRQLVEAGVLAEGTFELIGGDVVPKITVLSPPQAPLL